MYGEIKTVQLTIAVCVIRINRTTIGMEGFFFPSYA